MTLAELVQETRRKLDDSYTINPFRKVGLYAVEMGGIPLFYTETSHDAEMIMQILLAATQLVALDAAQGEPSDVPSDDTIES